MAEDKKQFEGSSAAEAAIMACEHFGVTRSGIEFDVISQEGEGIDRKVVIMAAAAAGAAPADAAPERDSDHQRERGRGRSQERTRGEERGRGRDRDDRSRRGGRDDKRRGGHEDRGENIDELIEIAAAPVPNSDDSAETDQTATIDNPGDRAAIATEIIEKIVEYAGFDVEVALLEDGEDEIQVELRGNGVEKVIGDRGEVLLALQFIVNRLVQRRDEGESIVVLDAAAYRRRRGEALEQLAKDLAAKAARQQKVVKLSPMSGHDRRIFHRTLEDDEAVNTKSEGAGLFRNLLIIPSEYASNGDSAA